jgi:hypothetical protein
MSLMAMKLKALGFKPAAVKCDYCKRDAALVTGDVIYPHRSDLFKKKFWQCVGCNAYVGCHDAGYGQGDGTTALGRLANAELREAKNMAHESFDQLWKNAANKGQARKDAYAWLASAMKVDINDCHIGMMDVEQCCKVVDLVEQKLDPDWV